MTETQRTEDTWRFLVGRPYRWQGVGMIGLGLVWLVLAVTGDGHLWRWIAGVAWLALGLASLLVARWDHRHGRGRYAGRAPESERTDPALPVGDR
ncbi:hypothetical protein [Curtobacterium sp. ISL-83]|uniref:hypothetical protein n=1 Tax=Curtobacterium sp. ISL-83 TaxID=2819145 RepID=UPI001BE97C5A|nr:hypothetical protein [Curtobacterium sp. ISL-83]MBT2503645.1 hypothetical protein [Curtobacterium sp. ISL-83]